MAYHTESAIGREEPAAGPGAAPGDPHPPGPAAPSVTTAVPPQCPTRTRLYRAGKLLDEGFPAEQLSERLAADERAVVWLDLHDPTQQDPRRRAYELGAGLAALRRVVAPMQEVVGRLSRADSHLRDEVLAPYYQDVYDHALRTAESVDAARDRVDRIADTQLNEQAAQLNEITKRLAAWAAIIAVPTAVTGFYGQNVPYPGFGRPAGFATSCVVMLTLAALLYWYLRRNRWL